VAEELHYDVLVVGAGNAALSAALAALEQGAGVGILEKAPRSERGGNSTLTGHMRFAYNSVEDLAALIRDPSPHDLGRMADELPRRTEAELWDELMPVTEAQSDPTMLQIHVSESYKTVRWLASKGHDWVPSFANRTTGNIVSMNGGGYDLQERNFRYVERDGGIVHYETAATELLQNQRGAVVGVRALGPDGFDTIRASATVLACGGFEGNAEMRARYLGPRWDTVRMRGVPFNTGDGLRMALNIGALPYGSWTTCHASPQDVDRPAFSPPSSMLTGKREWNRYMYPYSIMVNSLGQRFVDEADDIRALTYAKMGRAIIAQPGGIAYQIMDARVRRMNLYPPAYDTATGATAGSLEELAEALEIDPRGLVETVRTFNASVSVDPPANPNPFHRDFKTTVGLGIPKSNYAMPIDQPPYEGFAVRCGITFTFGGLKIEPRTGQVQHVAGRPIPGLFAAGEMVGGLFHGNYASGSGMMAGATWGRIAGTHAAAVALEALAGATAAPGSSTLVS
jgi:tricarballylate dehydrogenase